MQRVREFYRLVIERPVVNLNDRGMDVAKGREGLLVPGGLTGSPLEPNKWGGGSIHRVTYHEILEH